MKAMDSCWGEENMKQYTVEMKKVIAKCGHEDVPELSLPPFRSTYRFVNTMLNSANHMENQQYKLIEKMLEFMQGNQYNYNRPSYSQYSRNDDNMNNRFYMKQMMQKMMNGDMYDSNYHMDNYGSNSDSKSYSSSSSGMPVATINFNARKHLVEPHRVQDHTDQYTTTPYACYDFNASAVGWWPGAIGA